MVSLVPVPPPPLNAAIRQVFEPAKITCMFFGKKSWSSTQQYRPIMSFAVLMFRDRHQCSILFTSRASSGHVAAYCLIPVAEPRARHFTHTSTHMKSCFDAAPTRCNTFIKVRHACTWRNTTTLTTCCRGARRLSVRNIIHGRKTRVASSLSGIAMCVF